MQKKEGTVSMVSLKIIQAGTLISTGPIIMTVQQIKSYQRLRVGAGL